MLTSQVESVPNRIHLLFIAGFLALCILTWVDVLFPVDPTPSISENRQLATFPSFHLGFTALSQYTKKVDQYLDDHFGFRKWMIKTHARMMVQVFHSPTDSPVILGKDGWLFLSGHGNLDYYQSKTPFTPEELSRWKDDLDQDNIELRERGIHYLVVITPNKDTVYPEYMPGDIIRYRSESRLDQLMENLKGDDDLAILDLRGAMRAAKNEMLLYSLTDTHWNGNGAFVGYREIMARSTAWFPQLSPLKKEDLTASTRISTGDLAVFLGLGGILTEPIISVYPTPPARAAQASYEMPAFDKPAPPYYVVPLAFQGDDPSLPRAVIFHDSFGAGIMPFLAQNFSRSLFVPDAYFSQYESAWSIINREQPDLVILMMVERSLQWDGFNFHLTSGF